MSARITKSRTVKQQTLETFLLSHATGKNAEFTIQFSLVALLTDGHVRAMVFPVDVTGDVLQFELNGNSLRPDPRVFVGPDPNCTNCEGTGGILPGGQCGCCWVEDGE